MKKYIRKDLVGKTFNLLTILEIFPQYKNNIDYLKVQCKCGNIKNIIIYSVINNLTLSCGCLNKIPTGKRIKHGYHKHPAYNVWFNMVDRCYNSKAISYHNYGGRGIIVCDEWKDNPIPLCNWLVENGWKKGLQLDRIENNKNYEPNNCRIVTVKENANNKRSNVFIEYNNKKQTITQWAEELNIPMETLWRRLQRSNNNIEKSFNTPYNKPLKERKDKKKIIIDKYLDLNYESISNEMIKKYIEEFSE